MLMSMDIEIGTLQFVYADSLKIYDSSEGVERRFCDKCGINLCWRLKNHQYCKINVFSIEHQPNDLKRTTAVYIDHKPSFYDFKSTKANLTEARVIDFLIKNKIRAVDVLKNVGN